MFKKYKYMHNIVHALYLFNLNLFQWSEKEDNCEICMPFHYITYHLFLFNLLVNQQ